MTFRWRQVENGDAADGDTPAPPAASEPKREATAFVSALLAAVVVGLLGTAVVVLDTWVFEVYGWSLFVGAPFLLGFLAAILHGWQRRRATVGESGGVATLSMVMLVVPLLFLKIEGVLCILMAAPLGLIVAMLGGIAGHLVQRRWRGERAPHAPAVVGIVLLPLSIVGDAAWERSAPLLEVTTTVEIAAPPAVVWRRVVDFPPITAPPELPFRLGLAYPLRARIDGRGPGAVRYCEFSTGSFVEPIEVWDEPRLLRFAVTSNPPPMRELTPFGELHAPHLDGFLVSQRGQFRLEPAGAGTRVVATTWYRHHLWPVSYWTWWSDAILHRIHLRVLRHIAELAEADAAAGGGNRAVAEVAAR